MWQKPSKRERWFIRFRVLLVYSMYSIFNVYHSQGDGIVMFDWIADKINFILSDHLSASIHICGDFSIHYREWLVHSSKTDEEIKYCYDLSITYLLTKIVYKFTRVHGIANFLDHCPNKCSTVVLPFLCFLEHSLFFAKPKASPDIPCHRAIFRGSKADWDSFRSYIVEALFPRFFKIKAPGTAYFNYLIIARQFWKKLWSAERIKSNPKLDSCEFWEITSQLESLFWTSIGVQNHSKPQVKLIYNPPLKILENVRFLVIPEKREIR